MTGYVLGDLKSVIADDLARSDLTNQISTAITAGIIYFKAKRFYFNETRTATFATVAAQSTYDVDDDADIPLFLEIDEMFVTDSNGSVFPLGEQSDITDMQWLLGNGAGSGKPYSWAYYDRSFVFYPIPDAVYTITPMGHIEVAGPLTDGEIDNVWMTEAFELIRQRAKWDLYLNTIKSLEKAMVAGGPQSDNGEGGMVRVALNQLRSKTQRRQAGGTIRSTSF